MVGLNTIQVAPLHHFSALWYENVNSKKEEKEERKLGYAVYTAAGLIC